CIRCPSLRRLRALVLCFFFNAPPTTEIYPLSLHDALPISARSARPKASIISDCDAGGVFDTDQSVQSARMARLPRSGWRTLNVATPETVLSFRTTNF